MTLYWFAGYQEVRVEGAVSEATKYYSANGQVVAQRSTVSGLLFIHKDHLGSATSLTDSSGVVVQTIGYEPYGTEAYGTGGDYTAYRYTGQEADGTTALYYYGARYYDAGAGEVHRGRQRAGWAEQIHVLREQPDHLRRSGR